VVAWSAACRQTWPVLFSVRWPHLMAGHARTLPRLGAILPERQVFPSTRVHPPDRIPFGWTVTASSSVLLALRVLDESMEAFRRIVRLSV
jgi:hypothetical protein